MIPRFRYPITAQCTPPNTVSGVCAIALAGRIIRLSVAGSLRSRPHPGPAACYRCQVMREVTVILADSRQIVRQSLRALLDADGAYKVLAEASDGVQAVAMARQLAPDLMIMDLILSGVGGLEVIRRVRRLSPATRIVVLSMHSDEAYAAEALRSGAKAYVVKSATAMDLVPAIHEVVAGRTFISPGLDGSRSGG